MVIEEIKLYPSFAVRKEVGCRLTTTIIGIRNPAGLPNEEKDICIYRHVYLQFFGETSEGTPTYPGSKPPEQHNNPDGKISDVFKRATISH